MARDTAMLLTFVLSVLAFVIMQATQGATGGELLLVALYGILPSVFLAMMVGGVIPGKNDSH